MKMLSDNARGAVFMMFCMAGFSLNDALIKLMSGQMNLYQAVFLRGLFASIMMCLLLWRSGQSIGRPSRADWRLLALRLVGEVGGTICFLTAVFNMPLANATAILQGLPLIVTLAAAMWLGERVGWRRYLAISIGFVGMLIIVRPGAAEYNSYATWAVAACLFLALRDLTTRRLSAALPSQVVALITAVTITAMGGLVSISTDWSPVSAWSVGILALAAAGVLCGYLFGVMAMRVGDIGAIAPFRYSILVWAILLGMLLFDEYPDTATLVGAAILVATGVYTLHREVLATTKKGLSSDKPAR